MSTKKNLDKFVLGSAQFGMQYGINNSKKPCLDLVTKTFMKQLKRITKIDMQERMAIASQSWEIFLVH